ncbi:MAG: NAD-dependent epimerase/dehydratase family protein [Wenzhouxiangella sp.]|nr:NAD-dependent epimerase/dehydratase family protein [Wenzhouxiangella sp.]
MSDHDSERKRIAILGAGFVGSWVAERLLANGHQVRVIERPGVSPWRQSRPGEALGWTTVVPGDRQSLRAALAGSDVLINLSSGLPPGTACNDPGQALSAQLADGGLILDLVAELELPRYLLISSGGAVYGQPRSLPVRECHPTRPLGRYGEVRLALEQQALQQAAGGPCHVTVLRVANAYGARQRLDGSQGVISTFLHHGLHHQPLPIWGEGRQRRDFIHASDVAEAFALALGYSGRQSIFNIGSGRSTSVAEIASLTERLLGRTLQRQRLPGHGPGPDDIRLDCSLAARELGWQPRLSLEDGMRQTLDWLRTLPTA